MKKTACITLLSVLALGGLTTSCDEEYVSSPPKFSDLTVTSTDGGTTLYTNTKIVATAVQEKKGHLLFKAGYTWTTSPSEDVNHTYQKGVIYDNENHNPTDTIIFTHPGRYTIKFNGKFHISAADYEKVNQTVNIEDGKITYNTPSFLYYTIEIEKRVNVVAHPSYGQ